MDGARRARLILILGVMIAVFSGLGTFLSASSAAAPAPAPLVPTSLVVAAARELPIRTKLVAADVRVVQVNQDAVPPGVFKDPEDLIDKILIVPRSVGETLLPSKFVPDKAPTFTVLPPGVQFDPGQPVPPNTPNYRALSISVQDDKAVGGALQAGDPVDILYTLSFDLLKFLRPGGKPDRTADFSAKILLQRVPIIAPVASVYTIRTDAETAERLAYLSASGGTLQLLLRAPGDQRAPTTAGATFQNVFDQYRFRIPERFSP
ncbi:MAG: hypothetical protein EXR61_02600 [Chloroflexi bacterium]|nr:hypothetical protein [Chloroflexota bacterium]